MKKNDVVEKSILDMRRVLWGITSLKRTQAYTNNPK